MRQFQAIIGLLAILTIGAQTLRHAYVLFIEPRDSVLNKYEPSKQDIAESKSLQELITHYEAAQAEVEEFKKNNPKQPDEQPWEYQNRLSQEEPFQSKELLEQAILDWEEHNQQLYELHFFWAAGVVVSLLGTAIYLRIQRWAGICICILGVLEIVWATSPSFRTFGSQVEFDRLLTFKLVYSAVAVLLVAAGWCVAMRCQRTDQVVAAKLG